MDNGYQPTDQISQSLQAPVVPTAPQLPPTPPKKGIGRWLIVGLVVVLLVVVVLVWLLVARRTTVQLPESLGFTGRPTELGAIFDEVKTINGSCLASATLQPAGRNDAEQQTYLATLTLVSDPSSEAELAAALSSDACAAEITPVLDGYATALGLEKQTDTELLTVSYKAKSGLRFLNS